MRLHKEVDCPVWSWQLSQDISFEQKQMFLPPEWLGSLCGWGLSLGLSHRFYSQTCVEVGEETSPLYKDFNLWPACSGFSFFFRRWGWDKKWWFLLELDRFELFSFLILIQTYLCPSYIGFRRKGQWVSHSQRKGGLAVRIIWSSGSHFILAEVSRDGED